MNLTETLREARGAFPDIAFEVLEEIRGTRPLPVGNTKEPGFDFDVELHPLLFEWYFTKTSTHYIREIATSNGSEWLCIGAPSIASLLAQHSGRVQLIDADPEVVSRFPLLSSIDGLYLSEIGDVSGPQLADVVVVDPPWYVGDVLRWLSIARAYTRDGGTIISPIFPELTRPRAWLEREQVLAAASSLGAVELHPASISYSTPRFELESMRALGIPDPGDWRVADLLVIRQTKGTATLSSTAPIRLADRGWSTFRVGTQVVKLKEASSEPGTGPALSPIDGCPDNVLTSVSERDGRRSQIGIWTSRNRVAKVENWHDVASWLGLIQDPMSRSKLLESPPTSPSFQLLLDILDLRDGSPS
jgi:hypothetical protein